MRKAFIITVLILALLPLTYASLEDLGDGIIGCWDLESDGADSIFDGDMAATGSPTYVPAVNGNGLSQSDNNYLKDSSPNSTTLGDIRSISIWVNMTTQNSLFYLIGKDGQNEFMIRWHTDDRIRLIWYHGNQVASQVYSSYGVPSSGLINIVWVWDGNTESEMFVNGVSNGTSSGVAGDMSSYTYYGTGGSVNLPTEATAVIDNINWYNYTLTQTDIDLLYNSGNGLNCSGITSPAAPSQSRIVRDPVAYWDFDDISSKLIDTQGYKYNLTIANSPTQISNATCLVGDCVLLSDDASYFYTPDTTFRSAMEGSLSDYTYSMWVHPITFPDSGIIHWGSLSASASALEVYVSNSGVVAGKPDAGAFTGGAIPANEWTHIIYRQNSTSQALYVNGVQTGQSGTNAATLDDQFNIGAYYTSAYALNGYIDEVAAWNFSLNDTEIAALYNSGNALPLANFTEDAEPPADTTAPTISTNTNETGTTTANITITTDEAANITITYGDTTALLDGTESSASFLTTHNINLTGLDSATDYYYNVTLCDAEPNCATYGPFGFTTQTAPIPPPILQGSALVLEGTQLIGKCNSTFFNATAPTYYYNWYRNGTFNATGTNATVAANNTMQQVAYLDVTGLTEGDLWIFECSLNQTTTGGLLETIIDDFNESVGSLTASSQNDMGYNYSSTGDFCAYQGTDVLCLTGESITATYDFTYPVSNISFDAKFDNSGFIKFGQMAVDFSYDEPSEEYRVEIAPVGGPVDVGDTNYHHYNVILDHANEEANLSIDGVFQFSAQHGLNTNDTYTISSNGANLYIDNLTITTNDGGDTIASSGINSTEVAAPATLDITVIEPNGVSDDNRDDDFTVTWSTTGTGTFNISCYADDDNTGFDKNYTGFINTTDDGSENINVTNWDQDYYYIWCEVSDGVNTEQAYSTGQLQVNHEPGVYSSDDNGAGNVNDNVSVIFDGQWSDPNDYVHFFVSYTEADPECRQNNLTTNTSNCACFELNQTDGNANCTLSDLTPLNGTTTWYSWACDDQGRCSTQVTDTFDVNKAPTIGAPSLNSPLYISSTATCTVGTFTDQNGDSEKTANRGYLWYRNTTLIAGETGSTLDLSGVTIERGDELTCAWRTSDEHDYFADYVNSTAETIVNRAPSISNVQIIPQTYYTDDDIPAYCTPTDDDGDDLDIFYYWYNTTELTNPILNGSLTGQSSPYSVYQISNLTSDLTNVGDFITFSCVAFDGVNYSESSNVTFTVRRQTTEQFGFGGGGDTGRETIVEEAMEIAEIITSERADDKKTNQLVILLGAIALFLVFSGKPVSKRPVRPIRRF